MLKDAKKMAVELNALKKTPLQLRLALCKVNLRLI